MPETAFSLRAVRSSGPGGQNVNKVASKVELRVDLRAIEGLGEGARARLLAMVRNDLDAEGLLLVTSQKTRDQRRNIEDAREKVRQILLRALAEPVPRRKTRPTRGSVERRIAKKKQRSHVKAMRRGED